MKSLLYGAAAGFLVFFLLLIVFAGGTGTYEFLLWLAIGAAVATVTTKLLRLGAARG